MEANDKSGSVACTQCGTAFVPRLKFQTRAVVVDGQKRQHHFCSLPCAAGQTASGKQNCDVCGAAFALTFAYQAQRTTTGTMRYACSERCLGVLKAPKKQAPPAPPRVTRKTAVLNQKGGTGKTTTSVSVAAGLAEAGRRVLLVDADPQGNIGVSLGVRSPKTLYHVLIDGVSVEDAIVPLGENFDVITSDELLAAAEIKLAQRPNRGGAMVAALSSATDYDDIIIDCGPSLSLLNQNTLCFVDEVLIPVACDYLSLVGVKQVLRTIKNVSQHLGNPVVVGGVLPTMYDQRARVCRDALDALRKHFKELCLPPIRSNVRLKEAPSHKRTIFEHAPDSHGAQDYRQVVEWVLARRVVQVPAYAEVNA